MARLAANTVLSHPDTMQVVTLSEGEELPEWAAGLVGAHLLAEDEPVEAGKPKRTPSRAAKSA